MASIACMFKDKVCQQIVPVVSSYVDGLQIQLDERGVCAEQVYNADETALYWKAGPWKTLVAAFEQSALGRKECKEYLFFCTAMLLEVTN